MIVVNQTVLVTVPDAARRLASKLRIPDYRTPKYSGRVVLFTTPHPMHKSLYRTNERCAAILYNDTIHHVPESWCQ